jgi:predicted nucleic acid-binding protein
MVVQRQLAERGKHRAPSIPDLLIAATCRAEDELMDRLASGTEARAER